MKQAVKYLYAIKSDWMNFDVVSSFKPLLTTMIISKEIEKTFDQDLSDEFYKEYGFKLPYFILTNIISSYISGGYLTNVNGFLYFDLKRMRDLKRIPQSDIDTFNVEYQKLVEDFIKFCESENINFAKAEEIILSFIKTYDAQLLAKDEISDEFIEMDIEQEYFNLYLKEKKENDVYYFDFILKLCQGNLIKSYMFNEGVEQIELKDVHFILDSPVIYRILGYYDKYYESEYNYLIKLWKSQGVKLSIYMHNYEEVINLLERCKNFLSDIHFNYATAPEIALFFKEKGLTEIDIDEEIMNLEQKLHDLGIDIVDLDYKDFSEKYIEDESKIEQLLKNTYFASKSYNFEEQGSLSLQKMIDIDVKSIIFSYGLRGKNNINSFDKCKLFFVTKNTGLISTVLDYNKEFYPESIAPIIRDTLIGMVACANDMEKIQKLVERKIISYCYTSHKPSKKVLERFTTQVEAMKNEKQITDEQYLILKHNKSIMPRLVALSKDDYISYGNIHEMLRKVEYEIIQPIKIEYEKKVQDIEKEKNELVQKQKEIQKELDSQFQNNQDIEIDLKKERNKSVAIIRSLESNEKMEIQKVEKRIILVVNIIIAVITLLLILVNTLFFINQYTLNFLSGTILFVTIASIIWNGIRLFFLKTRNKIPFLDIIIKNKTQKISNKYAELLKLSEEVDL